MTAALNPPLPALAHIQADQTPVQVTPGPTAEAAVIAKVIEGTDAAAASADVPRPQAPPVVKKRAPVTNYPYTEEVHCRYTRRLPIPILENRHINWRQALTGTHGVSPLTLIERESGAAILIRRNGIVAKKPEAATHVELPPVTNSMAQSPLPHPKVVNLSGTPADKLGGLVSRGASPNASNVAIPPTAPQSPVVPNAVLADAEAKPVAPEKIGTTDVENGVPAQDLPTPAVAAPPVPDATILGETPAQAKQEPAVMPEAPSKAPLPLVMTPMPAEQGPGPAHTADNELRLDKPSTAQVQVEPVNKEDRELKDLLDKMHEQAQLNPNKTPGDLLDSDFFRRMAGFGELSALGAPPPNVDAQQAYDTLIAKHKADRLRMVEIPLWSKVQDLAVMDDLDEDLIQLIETQQEERRKAKQAIEASVTDGGLHFLVLSQHVSEAEDCLDRLRHLIDMNLEDHEDDWTSEDGEPEEEGAAKAADKTQLLLGDGGRIEAQVIQKPGEDDDGASPTPQPEKAAVESPQVLETR